MAETRRGHIALLRNGPFESSPLLRASCPLLPALDGNRACGARCQRYRLTAKSIQRLGRAKGAVGAGVGAVTEKGRDGKNARKGAKVGAAVGAVTGVLTGNGLEGAIKGAVIGGTGGAILGKMK